VPHDILRLLIVNFCERVVCLIMRVQQLVELRLERMSVS